MTSRPQQRLQVSHPVEDSIISLKIKRYVSIISICQRPHRPHGCVLIGVETQTSWLLLTFPSSRFGEVCLSLSSPARWAVISAATSGIQSSLSPRLFSCSASITASWVCGWLALMVWSTPVDHSTRYSVTSALGLWFFIRRGKQCLDFTVTVHFFHVIGCWIYNTHLKAALSWWLVNVACMALMAVIGEYLCMRTELRAIPVNTAPKSNL
uniref:SYS1 golgi trafficking protein n=1 Tax=Cyprinus carpio carpio TaxID=630221 RepID=A0A9J8C8A6_CYPCA